MGRLYNNAQVLYLENYIPKDLAPVANPFDKFREQSQRVRP